MNNSTPAIFGGKPVRKTLLQFNRPQITKSDIDAVCKTMQSGWLTTGLKSLEFEAELKKFTDAKYIKAVSSCTAALHLALVVSKIGPDDEVITSPLTFASTVNSIVHLGAKPVFVDVDKNTGNIDPALIERAITKRTKAIIVTHLYGRSAEMSDVIKICRRNHLIIIEDAAHALGSRYRGKTIGNIGDFTAFSFYATKNVTTAEGGALATNSKRWSDQIESYRLHGMSKNAWKRYRERNIHYYQVEKAGYKYNLADMNAALGISQLSRFKKNQIRRKIIWKTYNNNFKDLPLLIPPPVNLGDIHSMHLYTILLKTEALGVSRDEIRAALLKENIATSVHFISLHLMPYYKKLLNIKPDDFPNSKFISERTISLPLFASMSAQDVEDTTVAVKKVLRFYRK